MTTSHGAEAANPAPYPLTVRLSEACRITGMGRTKLYALIKKGEIVTVKIGRVTLIPVSSIETMLERHTRSTEVR